MTFISTVTNQRPKITFHNIPALLSNSVNGGHESFNQTGFIWNDTLHSIHNADPGHTGSGQLIFLVAIVHVSQWIFRFKKENRGLLCFYNVASHMYLLINTFKLKPKKELLLLWIWRQREEKGIVKRMNVYNEIVSTSWSFTTSSLLLFAFFN